MAPDEINPWIGLREQRSIAFSTGVRLGALAAIAGCATSAMRISRSGSAPIDRLFVLVLSAFVATVVWGVCAGLWLSRATSRRYRALEALLESSGERVARWCPASVRHEGGALLRRARADERRCLVGDFAEQREDSARTEGPRARARARLGRGAARRSV